MAAGALAVAMIFLSIFGMSFVFGWGEMSQPPSWRSRLRETARRESSMLAMPSTWRK